MQLNELAFLESLIKKPQAAQPDECGLKILPQQTITNITNDFPSAEVSDVNSMARFPAFSSSVNAKPGKVVAVSKKYVVYTVKDNLIRVVGLANSWRALLKLRGTVTDVQFFNHKEDLIAVVDSVGSLSVWSLRDVPEGQKVSASIVVKLSTEDREMPFSRVLFNPSNCNFLAVAAKNTIYHCDLSASNALMLKTKVAALDPFNPDSWDAVIPAPRNEEFSDISYSNTGHYIYAITNFGTVRVYAKRQKMELHADWSLAPSSVNAKQSYSIAHLDYSGWRKKRMTYWDHVILTGEKSNSCLKLWQNQKCIQTIQFPYVPQGAYNYTFYQNDDEAFLLVAHSALDSQFYVLNLKQFDHADDTFNSVRFVFVSHFDFSARELEEAQKAKEPADRREPVTSFVVADHAPNDDEESPDRIVLYCHGPTQLKHVSFNFHQCFSKTPVTLDSNNTNSHAIDSLDFPVSVSAEPLVPPPTQQNLSVASLFGLSLVQPQQSAQVPVNSVASPSVEEQSIPPHVTVPHQPASSSLPVQSPKTPLPQLPQLPPQEKSAKETEKQLQQKQKILEKAQEKAMEQKAQQEKALQNQLKQQKQQLEQQQATAKSTQQPAQTTSEVEKVKKRTPQEKKLAKEELQQQQREQHSASTPVPVTHIPPQLTAQQHPTSIQSKQQAQPPQHVLTKEKQQAHVSTSSVPQHQQPTSIQQPVQRQPKVPVEQQQQANVKPSGRPSGSVQPNANAPVTIQQPSQRERELRDQQQTLNQPQQSHSKPPLAELPFAPTNANLSSNASSTTNSAPLFFLAKKDMPPVFESPHQQQQPSATSFNWDKEMEKHHKEDASELSFIDAALAERFRAISRQVQQTHEKSLTRNDRLLQYTQSLKGVVETQVTQALGQLVVPRILALVQGEVELRMTQTFSRIGSVIDEAVRKAVDTQAHNTLTPIVKDSIDNQFTHGLLVSYEKSSREMFFQLSNSFDLNLKTFFANLPSYSGRQNTTDSSSTRAVTRTCTVLERLVADLNSSFVESQRRCMQHALGTVTAHHHTPLVSPSQSQAALSTPRGSTSTNSTTNSNRSTPRQSGGSAVSGLKEELLSPTSSYAHAFQQQPHRQSLSPQQSPGNSGHIKMEARSSKPNPQLKSKIEQLLSIHHYENAFALTLQSLDTELVSWLLSSVSPNEVEQSTQFSQTVVISLLVHFSQHVTQNLAQAMEWLTYLLTQWIDADSIGEQMQRQSVIRVIESLQHRLLELRPHPQHGQTANVLAMSAKRLLQRMQHAGSKK